MAAAPPPAGVRWGIIGCGDVCEKKSGPALVAATGSALVAVMRRDLAKARDFAGRHGAARAYDTVAGLLGDPEVNAVYVATPPALHCAQVLAAAAAGKHVLVEKPMGVTPAECDAMVAACAEAGVQLHVAYYRRFYPKWVAVRAALQRGEIGRVLGARLGMCNVPGGGGWRVDPAVNGGGHFVDVGSHRVDMLLYLLGGGPGGGLGGAEVESVAGFADNLLAHHAAENDTVGVLRLAGGVLVSMGFHYHTRPARDVLEVFGSEGTLVCDPFESTDARVLPGDGGAPRVISAPTPAPVHGPLVQAVVDCIVAGSDAGGLPGVEGARATRVMTAVLAGTRPRGGSAR